MKKIIFSGMMCATFIVTGVLVSQEKVEAGWIGYACTTKGWRLIYTNGSGGYNFAKGDINNWEFTNEEAVVTGTPGLVFTNEEDLEEEKVKCIANNDSSNKDSDGEGDFRVTIKTYDCNGNEESTKIQGSKVKLYEEDGDKEDEDKTNFKGEANFYNVDEGKYYVKCEVPGYVSLKDRSKDYYKSGTEKVKDGKRAHETCHLIKSSCDANVKVEKLAQTGGGLKDLISYIFSFVF